MIEELRRAVRELRAALAALESRIAQLEERADKPTIVTVVTSTPDATPSGGVQ